MSLNVDLHCVRSLVVLAEERHYGRAARRLNLTTSALSKRIQRLERQIGAALLVRSNGGIVGLTPSGEEFIHAARLMVAQIEAAARRARQANRDAANASAKTCQLWASM